MVVWRGSTVVIKLKYFPMSTVWLNTDVYVALNPATNNSWLEIMLAIPGDWVTVIEMILIQRHCRYMSLITMAIGSHNLQQPTSK